MVIFSLGLTFWKFLSDLLTNEPPDAQERWLNIISTICVIRKATEYDAVLTMCRSVTKLYISTHNDDSVGHCWTIRENTNTQIWKYSIAILLQWYNSD